MGSYNKIGGQYTQANPELLRTILRNEWNYNGLIVTDWYKNGILPTNSMAEQT